MNDLAFTELIDTESLQMIQNSFSEYTGLTLRVVDAEGRPVVKTSGKPLFCKCLKDSGELGAKRCQESDLLGTQKAFEEGKTFFYTCHAGLSEFVVPIFFENRMIGAIRAGRVWTNGIEEESLKEAAKELGIDSEKYIKHAKKMPCVPKEKLEEIADFLSEFAKALSVLAYANYKKLKKIQKTESAARSQSRFITGLTEDLRVGVKEWLDYFRETTEKYNNVPEIVDETNAILAKGQEVYAVIDGVADYIEMSGERVEYSENIYSVKKMLKRTVASIMGEAYVAKVSVELTRDESVPKRLLGNSGRIEQVVSKLCSTILSMTKEGGMIEIDASCRKTTYSVVLQLEIAATGMVIADETRKAVSKIMKKGVSHIFEDEESLSSKQMEIPLIIFLVEQMSGKISLEDISDDIVVFMLEIPQLDGEKLRA